MNNDQKDSINSNFSISEYYKQVVRDNQDISSPIAAIKSLTKYINYSKATTMSEFMQNMKRASLELQSSTRNAIAISAGCDLFLHFVTRTGHDLSDFEACKQHIIRRGENFAANAYRFREKIADVGLPFIKDGSTVLIHSYSRVVMQILLKAASLNRRFQVYITESRPTSAGKKALQVLLDAGIPSKLIFDASVGFYIEKVDMVLVGAEGVVENGGIINQIGTYQTAVVAKATNKPFYGVTESYKFVRSYPLNQYDIPNNSPQVLSFTNDSESDDNMPLVDYTPPIYISLLFTDLGVMTPAGVSDELIRIFQ